MTHPGASHGEPNRCKNLLSVDDLSLQEVENIFSKTAHYAQFLRRGERPPQRLAGKTQINLFYEDSTRTNLSFELAGKKLGADVLNVPVAASSVNKGESIEDTAQTLVAMGAHAAIIRHKEQGVQKRLASLLPCAVINAGDGAGEHPTQALLDAATILSEFEAIDGLTIAICGDVRHSRVAGSGARLLTRLGARVRFVGPTEIMPAPEKFPDIDRAESMATGLAGADVVMGLRVQEERLQDLAAPDVFDRVKSDFQINDQTLGFAKPGAKVMHPGPMNRGVEIDGDLADDATRSLILRQVFYGVATRMALLDVLLEERAVS